jgi:hypothetical protein
MLYYWENSEKEVPLRGKLCGLKRNGKRPCGVKMSLTEARKILSDNDCHRWWEKVGLPALAVDRTIEIDYNA